MEAKKYSLDIISLESGKEYIKHNQIIGTFQNEPFKLLFSNKTFNKATISVHLDKEILLKNKSISPYGRLEILTNLQGSELVFNSNGKISIEVFESDKDSWELKLVEIMDIFYEDWKALRNKLGKSCYNNNRWQ